jgi:hypothetical protein
VKQLISLALEIQKFFEEQEWDFCFIGGLAVQALGEPRYTQDADVNLLAGFGEEEKYIDTLLKRFKPRARGMKKFALRNRVVLLEWDDISLDVSLGGLPFEQNAVRRSRKIEYAKGAWLRTCRAEDLVVFKAFAGRPLDWNDVRGVIIRQGKKLDWRSIRKWLPPLLELKGTPEAMTELEKMRKEITALERRDAMSER